MPLRHDDPGRAIDLDEFEVKDQVLPCQLVIGIQYDKVGFHIHDNDGYLLSRAIVHGQLHPDFGFDIWRKTVDWKFDYRLGVASSIGIFHRNLDGLLLAYFHSEHTIVETFYYHTAADFKLQGVTSVGGVECRSVGEPPMVVNSYGIASFYFLSHDTYQFECLFGCKVRLNG